AGADAPDASETGPRGGADTQRAPSQVIRPPQPPRPRTAGAMQKKVEASAAPTSPSIAGRTPPPFRVPMRPGKPGPSKAIPLPNPPKPAPRVGAPLPGTENRTQTASVPPPTSRRSRAWLLSEPDGGGLDPGTLIGRYELLYPVARGGMAT